MARFYDEVGEDLVEGGDCSLEGGGALGGTDGVVAVGVEEFAEVRGAKDLAFGARAGAGFRHESDFVLGRFVGVVSGLLW